MSDRDNFAGGFITGAILGGILGGVLGATLTARQGRQSQIQGQGQDQRDPGNGQGSASLPRRRRWIGRRPEPSVPSQVTSEARIEEARRSLEDKIAQLNVAIDDARQQLNEPSAPALDPEPSPELG